MVTRVLRTFTTLAEGLLLIVDGYLLALLAAASRGRRARPPFVTEAGRLRFVVLIPAHDEESSIGATLESLKASGYPADRFELVVLADNCEDRTGDIAAAHGATVWSRSDASGGGKGAALAWGMERLWIERPTVEAVALVDADCLVSVNLLSAMEARLCDGARAVQVNYTVANPDESWSSALRFASFALVNTVRPLGKAALGLSAGLHGSGMGFRTDLLKEHPWRSGAPSQTDLARRASLIEDADYHLQLVAAGERVAFAPEAWVSSPMPTSLRSAESQQLRWEGGRWALLPSWTVRLFADGIQRRDAARVQAALEPLVPPQSLLLAGHAVAAGAAFAGRSGRRRRRALAGLLAQAVFVTGGLALVRAPPAVWRALVMAPALALWKVRLVVRVARGRAPTSWIRTERPVVPPERTLREL